jgi:hypothetical protein
MQTLGLTNALLYDITCSGKWRQVAYIEKGESKKIIFVAYMYMGEKKGKK